MKFYKALYAKMFKVGSLSTITIETGNFFLNICNFHYKISLLEYL